MAEQSKKSASIRRIENLSIVSLKVSRNAIDSARDRLQLAPPLSVTGSDPGSLWIGPDHWLLVSDTTNPESIIGYCNEKLAGHLHNAVDYSAGLAALRIAGPNARQTVACGSGIDFRPGKFPAGSCCRTRLAQIGAIIVAQVPERFDVYVDRSYGSYLCDWFSDRSRVVACSSPALR